MDIKAEVHTHTIASSHAYSTIEEMANAASDAKMELLCVTEHGPALCDAPVSWMFRTRIYPSKVNGIYVLKGAEANIIDYKGRVDIPKSTLSRTAPNIASVHRPVLPPRDKKSMTEAYIAVMNNPDIDILGHCGYPDYEFYIDDVLLEIKRLDKIVEINNNTFAVRSTSAENCRKIAKRCSELGVKLVLSTDAHSADRIGNVDKAKEILDGLNIDEELVQNTSAKKFIDYLNSRNRNVSGIKL